MIPLRDIVAWRAFAPWPSDSQVEQDLLLTRAMAAIFADDFLRDQVAMRGGTALHKVHLAPAARYSEDIDLVQLGERPNTHVEKALIRVLEPILGRPRSSMVADVALAVRNWVMPSRILRLEYAYQPTTAPQTEAKVKVEVNYSERRPFYSVVDLPYAPSIRGIPPSLTLRSYDLDEMLGTKMRALLQRDQGRDLFDLWWAWTLNAQGNARHRVDPERVVAAFNDYMAREKTVVRGREYERELARKLSRRIFRSDMDGMLRAGLPLYDIAEAETVVREVFLSRLAP